MAQETTQDNEFDVAPAWTAREPAPAPAVAPADLLSADKVEAVRFHPSRPGYAYKQVETFVAQVRSTLRYLERLVHQQQADLHDSREENLELQDRLMTLQATIEVFRAKGDPVRAEDGSYLTESQVQSGGITQAEHLSVVGERDAALAALAEARAEAERAWGAEAEVRTYIDETLMPWVTQQVDELQAQLEAAQTDLERASVQQDEADAPVADPGVPVAEHQAVQASLAEALAQVEGLRAQVEGLRAETDQASAQVAALLEENAALRAQAQSLQEQVAALLAEQGTAAEQVAAHGTETETLRGQILALSAEVEAARTDALAAAEASRVLQERHAALQDSHTTMEAAAAAAAAEMAGLREKHAAALAAAETAAGEAQSSAAQVQALLAEAEQAREALEDAKAELAQVRADLADLQERVTSPAPQPVTGGDDAGAGSPDDGEPEEDGFLDDEGRAPLLVGGADWEDAPSVEVPAVWKGMPAPPPPPTSTRRRILSLSPEVEALQATHEDIVLDQPGEEPAPRAAGAPLPNLLASAPEVLMSDGLAEEG